MSKLQNFLLMTCDDSVEDLFLKDLCLEMASEVERLFKLCDREGKGYLTEQDLHHICPQLDQKDIEFIFAQLDTDGSGRIDKEEFCNGFKRTVLEGENRGYGGMQRRASVIEYSDEFGDGSLKLWDTPPSRAGDEVFDSDAETVFPRPNRLRNLDDDDSESLNVDFSLPCQEEVVLLYQQLQSAGVPQLLRNFERIVGSFYKEFKEQKDENQRLQHVYETEKDMYNKRMEEVEYELDQQVMLAERKAREEERSKLTKEKEEMQSRMAEEMRTMQSNIERLQKMESVLEKEGQKLSHQKELQERLKEVCSENTELRRGLAENHLELAMIKSELAHVRADYEHKQNELIRQKDEVSAATQESETMQRQIQLLFEANKKLHETNESLRDALDSRASVIKQFNLRTPSPHLARTASEGMAMFQTHDQMRIQTPATLSEVPTEEDDSGLVISFDDGNCSSDSDKPKGDIEPMVGLHPATGPAERTFRVVMCGEAAVGKSSLVMRLVSGKHCANLPSTLGVDFHVKTVNVDGRNVALQLWDTAGQERFRSLCKSYFRRADGAILVYDVSSEHSFIKIRDWIDTIKDSVERQIPVILVGNKCDLRADLGEVVSNHDGAALAAKMGVLFMETSALDGSNVDSSMLSLTREMMAVEDVDVRAAGVILSPRVKPATGCFSKCKG
ncbi:Ras and EF-hand domain-containing protein [Trichostrongylus colubriformis]|uniref:Ras and EF-hand domain-containing protein homolog n=1 Tax=Trichostrongylus colubriformis TaxID=6319 RepID=A0AAN8FAK2_TRICO